MRKVLLVIGSLGRGGAEAQLSMLARGLKSRRWDVSVYVFDRRGPYLEQLDREQIKVFGGKYVRSAPGRLSRSLSLAISLFDLIRTIRSLRPDVVHTFLPLTNFIGSLAARVAGAPMIVTSKRGLGTHQDRNPMFGVIDRISNRFSCAITANSIAVALDTARRDGYPASQIHIIPNGLYCDRYDSVHNSRERTRRMLQLEPNDIAIVKVANLISYKGHIDLIEAFAKVAANNNHLKLFMIGEDRGIESSLRAHADMLGVSSRLAFLGGQEDVAGFLGAMDIGVMASHEEGLSNALMEKLAAGLPVVATNVGGNPELLAGMPNCYLVRTGDSSDLAAGIQKTLDSLATDGPFRKTRSATIRSRYDSVSMVDGYERLYGLHLVPMGERESGRQATARERVEF